MKKIIAIALTLLMLLAVLPGVSAAPADYAELRLNFKPTSNAEGRVMLEISAQITNGSADQSIRMLEFRYENDLIASVDELSGQSHVDILSNPLNMSLTGMAGSLEIEVSYIDFHGGTVTKYASVSPETAEPQISFKRTADRNAVLAGESVKLTYMIKNEGSVTLQDVEIYDEIAGGVLVGSIDLLYPGDMKEFSKSVKVEKDVKSEPRVSFRTAMDSAYTTMMLESMSIVINNPQLVVTLKSDVSSVQAGGSVTLVCNVVNEGNVPFTNVTISDETLGTIIESAQIEVGKAYSWNKLIKPVASQNYLFTVNALDASGQAYTASSNITTVEVIPIALEEGAETLEVSVTPNTKELEQPGEITFNFLLRNSGTMDATGVTISDRDGNVLERLNSLAPGDKMLPVSMSIAESGEYFFTVDATLASGVRVQRVTRPMNITVGVVQKSEEPLTTTVMETPAPTPDTQIVIDNDRVAGLAPWMLMLIIFIALLIVACVVVLVILNLRAANRREEEEEVYLPPRTNVRRPVQQMPERDPYDYREEISRAASEYSRPAAPVKERRPERYEPAEQDDEEIQTVYKARKPKEPHTKRS